MNNTMLSLFSIMFLASCAITNKPPLTLFQSYVLYSESTNENNIKDVAELYFSQSLLGDDYVTNPDASSQLLFKNYMNSVANHYEIINNQNGCLAMNGYDKEKAPLIISLKYIKNNGYWLIDKIHVVFIESINDFSKEAKCPESFSN